MRISGSGARCRRDCDIASEVPMEAVWAERNKPVQFAAVGPGDTPSRFRGEPMKQVPPTLTGIAAISALLASTSGCSFIFVKTPSTEGRVVSSVRARNCTSSKLAPGFDTAFGTLELVRTSMAAAADDSVYANPNQPLSRGADIALGASFTALFVGSAIYGFVNTSRCSRLQSGGDADEPTPREPAETWGANAQETAPAAAAAPGSAIAPPAPAPAPAPSDAAPPDSPAASESPAAPDADKTAPLQ